MPGSACCSIGWSRFTRMSAYLPRAESEGWVGEIEGVDMTLAFLRAKGDDARRRTNRPVVALGIPPIPAAPEEAR
jgi:hypothetical protein